MAQIAMCDVNKIFHVDHIADSGCGICWLIMHIMIAIKSLFGFLLLGKVNLQLGHVESIVSPAIIILLLKICPTYV
jgi:hypothetical protein